MCIGCSLYHLLLEAPEGFRKRSSRPKAATKELHSRLTSAKDEPPPLALASGLTIAARLAQGNRVSPPGVVRVWHARWCARYMHMHMHMHMRGRHGRCRHLLGQRTLSRSSTREGWRRGPGDQRPCRGEGSAPGARTYVYHEGPEPDGVVAQLAGQANGWLCRGVDCTLTSVAAALPSHGRLTATRKVPSPECTGIPERLATRSSSAASTGSSRACSSVEAYIRACCAGDAAARPSA